MYPRIVRLMAGLFLIGMGLASSLQAAETATGTPKLVFPESRFDFKSAIDGATIVHDFVVKNSGDAELSIKRVKSG
ncbi:MAG: hypothetical protein CSA22_01135 [Deltaproteobacteria bacterium]|nr:MAG: hypothetical protein CSA22_01135 [Deltaproteobacteria bacterium]